MDEYNLVEAVRQYARKHYNTRGWDIVVEAWADGDILEAIEDASTPAVAIARVAKIARIQDSVRADVQAEAF
jgi:hypothetical protein